MQNEILKLNTCCIDGEAIFIVRLSESQNKNNILFFLLTHIFLFLLQIKYYKIHLSK